MAVSFDGVRLNDADSNTGWGNYNTGGGAPASEAANAYQQTSGGTTGSVGKKVTSTTTRQGVDYNGSNVNYSANNYLWYCKVYVADAFDLEGSFGLEVAIGSADTNNYRQYNLGGSTAVNDAFTNYPARGGYQIVAIDPTISGWAAGTQGTIDTTQISWYAVGARFQNGFAKAENVAMDAIDYGTGGRMTGTVPNPAFKEFWYGSTGTNGDQTNKSARFGYVNGAGNSMIARGILRIGTPTAACTMTDNDTILTFPDGYHSAGKFGILVDMSFASTLSNVSINNTIIGEGRIYTGITDTRPDFTVTGTTGSFTSAANLRNFRNITYNSASTIDGADIECQLLTQGTAEIKNSVIRTNAAASVACLQDPTFGTTSGLHDVEFIQSGSGHAIEIDTPGTYDLTNITFTGYNAADFQSDSAIFVSTTGIVVINVSGGNTPTYETAGSGNVTVNNTVNVIVTALDADTLNPIQNARVHITAAAGGPLATGTVIYDGTVLANVTDSNGQISTAFDFSSNQPITGRVRRSTVADGTLYQQGSITGTITSTGFETTVILIKDE